ncbi:MAG: acetolactate decarboxylase [Bacteroidetes bacterium]|nr:acetolactate decarboxylase [Bacteroidota bacterium]
MKYSFIIFTSILFLFVSSCTKEVREISRPGEYSDVIFQYSTKVDLMNGEFEGNLTQAAMLEKGDFGIGTFNGVDGEMVIYQGTVYRVSFEGPVLPASEELLIPFVMVKKFMEDKSVEVNYTVSADSLKKDLLRILEEKDELVAIRIHGNFSRVKARSVPKQTPPYPSIAAVVELQSVFDFENVTGDIIGFWLPEKFDNINFPGFHFHFLGDNKDIGGHALDFELTEGVISFDFSSKLEISLIE